MLTTIASVGSEFQREIVDSGRLASFLFFVALLGTFGFIRTSTWMIKKQVSWWPGNVEVGGTHVHHLVWGIITMMIVGYVGVVHQPDSPWREICAVLFAIGMGLTLDEFALWLELKDVYWSADGRKSIDAMFIAGCVAGILTVGLSSWWRLADRTASELFAAVGFWGLLGIVLALVCASKEKFWMALGSLLIWPIGLIGAIRLAKPNSFWARRFYKDHRMAESRERYPGKAADAGPAGAEGSGSPAAAASASDS